MSQPLTCEHCGHTGADVPVKLVRYPAPETDWYGRPIVRYAYATEAHCVDVKACDARVPA